MAQACPPSCTVSAEAGAKGCKGGARSSRCVLPPSTAEKRGGGVVRDCRVRVSDCRACSAGAQASTSEEFHSRRGWLVLLVLPAVHWAGGRVKVPAAPASTLNLPSTAVSSRIMATRGVLVASARAGMAKAVAAPYLGKGALAGVLGAAGTEDSVASSRADWAAEGAAVVRVSCRVVGAVEAMALEGMAWHSRLVDSRGARGHWAAAAASQGSRPVGAATESLKAAAAEELVVTHRLRRSLALGGRGRAR